MDDSGIMGTDATFSCFLSFLLEIIFLMANK